MGGVKSAPATRWKFSASSTGQRRSQEITYNFLWKKNPEKDIAWTRGEVESQLVILSEEQHDIRGLGNGNNNHSAERGKLSTYYILYRIDWSPHATIIISNQKTYNSRSMISPLWIWDYDLHTKSKHFDTSSRSPINFLEHTMYISTLYVYKYIYHLYHTHAASTLVQNMIIC